MIDLDTITARRIKRFIIRLVDLTDPGSKCLALRYHGDKERVEALTGALGIGHLLYYKGFAIQVSKPYKLIFYDDSLEMADRLHTFVHEAGHCIFRHVTPPYRDGRRERPTEEDMLQHEWEAEFFTATFLFVADGALQLMQSWGEPGDVTDALYGISRGLSACVGK